jgi:hypothetical protein
MYVYVIWLDKTDFAFILHSNGRAQAKANTNWFNSNGCYAFPRGIQFQWQNSYKSTSENYSAVSWRPPPCTLSDHGTMHPESQ